MPFMPQRTGPPTNSALRALQEIMMMKIQAGQRMKQMEIQHENRMKELDKAYKHDKLMAEDRWEREAPLRQLKFDIETRKVQEQNYKDKLRAKDRRFQLFKDEQDVLYKQQQAKIQALTDRAANQRILNQIKLEKTQNNISKRQEEAYKGLESNLGQFIINYRKQENENRGGGFWGKGSTEAGKSNTLLPYEQRLINQMMTMIKMSAQPGVKQMSLIEVYDTIKKKIKEQPDFSFEVPQTKLNEIKTTQPKY